MSKAKKQKPILVGLVMGSQNDWETVKHCAEVLDQLGIAFEAKVVSAHRTPDFMFEYAAKAQARGLKVLIAAAGGAAHLPGMIAAKTLLPVLGIPVPSKHLNGLDSLLSIVQMPKGIPVGTLAIGESGARNAAFLAAAILGTQYPEFFLALDSHRKAQESEVLAHSGFSL